MSHPQLVLAVDPGAPHHGLVLGHLGENRARLVGVWQIEDDQELYGRFEKWASAGGIDRLILEEFRLYPWQARSQGFSDFPVPQTIGVLKYLANRFRIPVSMQKAAVKREGRQIAKDRGLPMTSRALGSGRSAYRGPDFDPKWLKDLYGVRSSQHIRDALAHLVWWTHKSSDSPVPAESPVDPAAGLI